MNHFLWAEKTKKDTFASKTCTFMINDSCISLMILASTVLNVSKQIKNGFDQCCYTMFKQDTWALMSRSGESKCSWCKTSGDQVYLYKCVGCKNKLAYSCLECNYNLRGVETDTSGKPLSGKVEILSKAVFVLHNLKNERRSQNHRGIHGQSQEGVICHVQRQWEKRYPWQK